MKLISITPSTRKGKRLTATFETNGKTIQTHFGQQGSSTYIDHKDNQKKQAYIARHRVNEDWSNATSAGTLARFILWEETSLATAIKKFKQKFNLN